MKKSKMKIKEITFETLYDQADFINKKGNEKSCARKISIPEFQRGYI